MSRLAMTQNKRFERNDHRYRVKKPSARACINYFLDNNKNRVDVLQYNSEPGYCFGLTEKQLKTGKSIKADDNWYSLDLRPGYIVDRTHVLSKAHQNSIDMQKQIEKDTPVLERCEEILAGDPLDPEFGPCTCYKNASDAIKSTASQWVQYFVDKVEYKNYRADKAKWDQKKSDKREELKNKIVGYSTCNVCGVAHTNCEDPWRNTGDWRRCGGGGLCQNECKYKDAEVTRRLQTWENNNPKPTQVDNPGSGPSDIPSNTFQCCTNIIQNVTVDDTAEVLQNCSQKIILNEAEKEEQGQLDKDLQEKLVNTQQDIIDLDNDTTDTTDTTDPESKSNTTMIIIVVAAVLFVILVGFLIWYFYFYRHATPSVSD